MRSRGIKAGDVVQVVRDCCGRHVGPVFVVRTLEFVAPGAVYPFIYCVACDWKRSGVLVAWAVDRGAWPIAWLRRFDPPVEPIEEINRLWEPERETIKVPR